LPRSPQPTGPGNHIEERLATADVLSLGELGPKQRLYNRILKAYRVGEPDEPVRIKRVRCSLHPVENDVDTFGLPGSSSLCTRMPSLSKSGREGWRVELRVVDD
jgi:hypothetical protein